MSRHAVDSGIIMRSIRTVIVIPMQPIRAMTEVHFFIRRTSPGRLQTRGALPAHAWTGVAS
jgi:hypothetical protein